VQTMPVQERDQTRGEERMSPTEQFTREELQHILIRMNAWSEWDDEIDSSARKKLEQMIKDLPPEVAASTPPAFFHVSNTTS